VFVGSSVTTKCAQQVGCALHHPKVRLLLLLLLLLLLVVLHAVVCL
jgi:hypothetical protein